MLILIEKDSATKVPKECTHDDAAALAEQFVVHVIGENNALTPWADYVASLEPPVVAMAAAPAKKVAAKKAAAKTAGKRKR